MQIVLLDLVGLAGIAGSFFLHQKPRIRIKAGTRTWLHSELDAISQRVAWTARFHTVVGTMLTLAALAVLLTADMYFSNPGWIDSFSIGRVLRQSLASHLRLGALLATLGLTMFFWSVVSWNLGVAHDWMVLLRSIPRGLNSGRLPKEVVRLTHALCSVTNDHFVEVARPFASARPKIALSTAWLSWLSVLSGVDPGLDAKTLRHRQRIVRDIEQAGKRLKTGESLFSSEVGRLFGYVTLMPFVVGALGVICIALSVLIADAFVNLEHFTTL